MKFSKFFFQKINQFQILLMRGKGDKLLLLL